MHLVAGFPRMLACLLVVGSLQLVDLILTL